jgi:hypothetical protein
MGTAQRNIHGETEKDCSQDVSCSEKKQWRVVSQITNVVLFTLNLTPTTTLQSLSGSSTYSSAADVCCGNFFDGDFEGF